MRENTFHLFTTFFLTVFTGTRSEEIVALHEMRYWEWEEGESIERSNEMEENWQNIGSESGPSSAAMTPDLFEM